MLGVCGWNLYSSLTSLESIFLIFSGMCGRLKKNDTVMYYFLLEVPEIFLITI